jgi:cell shape-determining protein MreC
MARKHKKITKGWLFTWLLLTGLIFTCAPHQMTGKLNTFFNTVFRGPLSMSKAYVLSSKVSQPANDFSQKEAQYKNHIANLNQLLLVEKQKNELLSGLRAKAGFQNCSIVLADIVSSSITGPRNEMVINQGTKNGIAVGQYVMGDNSIIGTISEVTAYTAKVRLITDKGAKTAAVILGEQTYRVMQGLGNNQAKISMLKQKVKIGKEILAAKKNAFLPSSMISGSVVRCEKNDKSPLLWDLIVKPSSNIENLSNVAVIVTNTASNN